MLAILVIGILVPVIAGLGETTRAAFGILPALGKHDFNLSSWQQLFQVPGFTTS